MEETKLMIYHDLIAGIVAAMEARDFYTASHSMRVSDMTEYICRILNLSSERTEQIHIAAHVHDIGKIGIPDTILLKKSDLSDGEWEIMKSHCKLGYDILQTVNSFEQIAEIVLHHHERFDGQGYPDQIRGAEIPLGSRIIAIADSIDAMLSDRSYRNGMSFDRCRAEIERNKNKMYDPQITDAVLMHWDEVITARRNTIMNVSKGRKQEYELPVSLFWG